MGRSLPEEITRAVESFYEDDEFIRQMPGKKDYVSIAENVHVQKRLILSNLKEYMENLREVIKIKRWGFLSLINVNA